MTGKLLNPEQIKCQAVCLVRLNERTEWENRPEKDRSQTNSGLVGTISNEAYSRFRLGSLLFNEIRAASYEISKNNTINSFGNGSFYICKLVTNVWKKFRPIFFSHALSSSCDHSFSHFSDPFFVSSKQTTGSWKFSIILKYTEPLSSFTKPSAQ